MYRSQEIIQIFNEYNIHEYITEYILEIERQILFRESIYYWSYCKKISQPKMKRFFYDENNELFLKEIIDIQGDFDILKIKTRWERYIKYKTTK